MDGFTSQRDSFFRTFGWLASSPYDGASSIDIACISDGFLSHAASAIGMSCIPDTGVDLNI
ncbi:hypothetical protein, partial [Mycetohabitans sp. B4]|uniref:hypothetical protein n=1 Tax=Mycetohabitans sp. B4 TaxID=2841842 RepID=UPI001F2C3FA9